MTTPALGRLLIVDDEIELLSALRTMLTRHGYEAVGFTSGGQALDALKAGGFDLLLTDLKMPEMDGIVVLRAALEIDPDLVGIMMTGQGTVETAVETMKVGALDYVLKPFQTASLLPVLSRAMAVRRLRQQARQLMLQNSALTRRLEAELARAGEVQAGLLPREVPRLSGFELAARCMPAHEVGGDFYDWQQPLPGVLTLTVGDVMGKGMPAALLMATVRATLRAASLRNPPAAALELVQQAMLADLERTDSFVTLFHARLDVPSRSLSYADAGHGHVFVLRDTGAVETLTQGGPPLGVPIKQPYQEGVTTLQPGDSLVVYSDGLVEARPEAPLDRRAIADRVRSSPNASAMVQRLVDLVALTGPPADDLTVVVLRCHSHP
jgi:sigma-B regulation protein RsbU (phosphoserine phosphatase)